MASNLYLFPDTNVFLQCKPLEHVGWEEFSGWERIEVVVTRPVQAEIDALKGKGNSRQASKARAATSLLRRLLDEGSDHLVLQEKPLVHLTVRLDLKPDASATALNYDLRDDQLVGTALAFQEANQDADVRLLTDDTGVMFSARTVKATWMDIPSSWVLPAEADEAEKRERVLRDQIVQLQKAEPQFEIDLEIHEALDKAQTADAKSDGVKRVTKGSGTSEPIPPNGALRATVTMYEPLEEEAVGMLMSRLTERFPQATDFGPKEAHERQSSQIPFPLSLTGHHKEVFTPASDREIKEYKEAYVGWQLKCRERFEGLHEALNSELEWPQLIASIRNSGSRPAEHSLVVIKSKGAPFLRPPAHDTEEDDEHPGTAVDLMVLPKPPVAPSGRWRSVGDSVGSIARMLASGYATPAIDSFASFIEPPLHRFVQDDNSFYWRDGTKGMPSKLLALTCKQWRHAQGPEQFRQFVQCPLEPGEHSGAISVEVHAANLTVPVARQLPVRIWVDSVTCQDLATAIVELL